MISKKCIYCNKDVIVSKQFTKVCTDHLEKYKVLLKLNQQNEDDFWFFYKNY